MNQDMRTRARKVIDACPMSVLTTIDSAGFPQCRTMWTPHVDEDFTVYFVTGRPMEKCTHVAANPRVGVFWSTVQDNALGMAYVDMKGEASVTDDQALRDRFWDDMLAQYFPGGKTDPSYVIMIVKPTEMTVMDDMETHEYPLPKVRF